VPVKTSAEKALEAVWSHIFNLPTDKIGREANFLAMGGDSISAISLTGDLRKLGYHLAVLDILKSPKLRDMASAMGKLETETRANKAIFSVPKTVMEAVKEIGLTWDHDIEYGELPLIELLRCR
jgi:aryl carrier-like protein